MDPNNDFQDISVPAKQDIPVPAKVERATCHAEPEEETEHEEETEGLPPDALHVPEAEWGERIKNRDRDRLTPVAREVCVQLINEGCGNSRINQILRDKKFILDGERDLGHRTLNELRVSKECQMRPVLLTKEARQVGHLTISALVVHWGNLMDKVWDRLHRGGDFGRDFGKNGASLSEMIGILTYGTKFFMETFAPDLPMRIKAELDEVLSAAEAESRKQTTEEQASEKQEQAIKQSERIIQATFNRAMRELNEEQRRDALESGEEAKPLEISPPNLSR